MLKRDLVSLIRMYVSYIIAIEYANQTKVMLKKNLLPLQDFNMN